MTVPTVAEQEIDRIDAMTRVGQVVIESREAFNNDHKLQKRMDRDFEIGHVHTSHCSK